MKQFKSLIALMLAAILVVGLAVSANAVNISIKRDDSYVQSGTQIGNGNAYTAYKIFSAVHGSGTTVTNASGYNGSGTANVAQGTEVVSYTATKAVRNAIVGATGEDANVWFDFAAIPGSEDYTVTWKSGADTSAASLQKLAKTLIKLGAYEGTGTTLTFNDTNKKWEANVNAGYYVIVGAAGNNLIAATTDIEINEKNAYPPIDKEQADKDYPTYNHDDRDVAIGDILNYHVTITVPATAKVGDEIVVYDTASQGLDYVPNSITVSPSVNGTLVDASEPNKTWSKKLTIAEGDIGKTYVFSFNMKVNSSALVDTGKKNEAGLKYGASGTYNYESKPTEVKYKTYYAGIHKYDGADSGTSLAGVKFTLSNASGTFLVAKSGTYYYPNATTGSGTVVTDAKGMIIIRGLDDDVTYTLHEIETLNGYNLLDHDITLNVHEDDASGTALTKPQTDSVWTQVPNNKGQVLPSTGGIGTTIFYVIGAVLVLGAAAIMIARRKAEQE